jgi:general secretion pathway protein G
MGGGKVKSQRRVGPSAFTLVELLVVIVIIGILIALLIPAAMGALARSRTSSIAIEISNISASLQAYKTQYQTGFPPDFSYIDGGGNLHANEVNQMLARHFRLRDQATDVPFNPYRNNQRVQFQDLDCGEALVFWLMGFSDNSQRPLTGTINTTSPRKPALFVPSKQGDLTPAQLTQIQTDYYVPEKTALFEFDKTRLDDRDKDGFPEYYPRFGNQAPYIYFNSSSYRRLYTNDPMAQPLYFLNLTDSTPSSALLAPRPYLTKAAPVKENVGGKQLVLKSDFAEPETFQIIAPGLDGRFGEQVGWNQPGQGYAFPDGPYPDKSHKDNITNFAAGTLESKIP